MSPSFFLSRTNYCLFISTPTIRAAIHRAALLRLPHSSHITPESAESEEKHLKELNLRLQDQLAKIGERLAHADNIIQQQASTLNLTQRQQSVLERRIVALEEESARTQQRITETRRLASDVVLQHRNVEVLVQQMEKEVLKHSSSISTLKDSTNITGQNLSNEKQDSKNKESKENQEEINNNKPSNNSSNTNTNTTNISSSGAILAQVAALSTRIEALQARIEHLTLEKLVLDKVHPHTQQQNKKKIEEAVARASSSSSSSLVMGEGENSASLPSPQILAKILKNTGAFPFKDSTGTTRISSQKIIVRGVPVNFGAADVRNLFSRVGTVVSCVVRRMPIKSQLKQQQSSSSSQSIRYRSQKQQLEVGEDVVGSDNRVNSNSTHSSSLMDRNITLDEQERIFEITFQEVEYAVRAVLELEGYKMGTDAIITVEPMVSADIIAALQQLEQESKKN